MSLYPRHDIGPDTWTHHPVGVSMLHRVRAKCVTRGRGDLIRNPAPARGGEGVHFKLLKALKFDYPGKNSKQKQINGENGIFN